MGNCAGCSMRWKKSASTPAKFTEIAQIVNRISRRGTITQNVIKKTTQQDLLQFYDIEEKEVLGSGFSGQVKICMHRETSLRYALKTLHKTGMAEDKIQLMREEIKCMTYLDHPNIMRIHEVFETEDNIYLILELCGGGHLLERLQLKAGHACRESVACKYVYTIVSAIAYCHANNIVHRDLKLENILFESSSAQSDLKLIDFGLSQYVNSDSGKMHQSVGTPQYVAPEVLSGNYDAKCDIWSIGVITFMLLSGAAPFGGATEKEILQKVAHSKWQFEEALFRNVSAEAKDFIIKCLTRNPDKRPSAKQLLKHEWFARRMPQPAHNKRKSVSGVFYSISGKEKPLPSMVIMDRIGHYTERTVLSRILLDVVAHTLLPNQVAHLRRQFQIFDVSHSGEITVQDLRTILQQFDGYTEECIDLLLSHLDLDQNGKIGYHEFLAATISLQEVEEENLIIAFERLSGHTQYITKAHIEQLLGKTNYNLEEILKEVGLGNDAKIGFDHFKTILFY